MKLNNPANWYDPADVPMNSIIVHWTAGKRRESDVEYASQFYHYIIQPNGAVRYCNDPWLNWTEENEPLNPDYIPHVGGFNTCSIGVAFTGMFGTVEGKEVHNPFTADECEVMWRLLAELSKQYGVPVNHIFPHSAILPKFGRGRAKQDVNWLPNTGWMGWKQAMNVIQERVKKREAIARDKIQVPGSKELLHAYIEAVSGTHSARAIIAQGLYNMHLEDEGTLR